MDIQFQNRLCTVYFISMCFRESNRQTDKRINEVFVSVGLSNVSVMIKLKCRLVFTKQMREHKSHSTEG